MLMFCLAFRKALCFRLVTQRTALLHHDWLYLEEVSLDGICLLINERLFALKEVHRELIGVSTENFGVKVSENC